MVALPSNFSLAQKAVRTFCSFPLVLIAIQFPASSVGILGEFLPSDRPIEMLLSLALLFPYFCIASFVSSAATFQFVQHAHRQAPISILEVSMAILKKWRTLIPVSLLTGLVTVLGLAALILPSLYFMTVYFFVPFLVMSEGNHAWSVYLLRSKKLVQASFLRVFVVLVIVFVGGALAELISIAGIMGRFLATATATAVSNLWVAYLFIALSHHPSLPLSGGPKNPC